jgi:hypothetical protein
VHRNACTLLQEPKIPGAWGTPKRHFWAALATAPLPACSQSLGQARVLSSRPGPSSCLPAAPQPPVPAAAEQQPADTSAVLAALPPEVSSGFQQVLELLHGSRDSIRASQSWFMACVPYAAGMAEMMLQASANLALFHA